MLFDLVRYKNRNELPFEQYPALSDYFTILNEAFIQFEVKPQIKGIVSLYPTRPRKTKMDILPFYSFSTNRTGYAALKQLENVFAEFYLQTEILPVINPIHASYLDKYKELPLHIVRKFQKRGVILYGN